MSYVIGIDIGGTFTDAFATDENGVVLSAKTPSTPPDFSRGLLEVLREIGRRLGIDLRELLSRTSYICHGTTATLNALVTGATAKVGFLTTRGHADSIAIMNLEGRYAGLAAEEIQNMTRANKPPALVPRTLIREIDERVDYKGAVVVPLDEVGVRRSVRELLDQGVEAIAVSLLWSFRNPKHEQRVREIIHEHVPGLYVALSSELTPRIREYPRSATTIMSTQVGPTLRDYLRPLERDLRELGWAGSLLVMQGSGGTISAQDAPAHAITTIGSTLTGGVIGCVSLGRSLGHRNIISTDMGGTTFLAGLVVDGKPLTGANTVLNQHTLNIPMVKVQTIGNGGGAIAWIDGGGNLRIGPRSAGAVPGPACYGQGGSEPTVTDADLVLGILNPDFFLAGRKRLHPDLARAAIDRAVAKPLKMTVEEAAAAIYSIQNAQASDLVRQVVVNSGYDPREFVLYAFGGAGPCHCAGYTADLGVGQILIPMGNTAAAFSAFGLAASNIVLTAELSQPENFPVSAGTVNEAFRQLEAELRDRLSAQRIPFSRLQFDREIDIRYTLQLAEVATPVRDGELDEGGVHGIANGFEELYARLYGKGSGFREAGIQFITYRIFATGYLPQEPRLPETAAARGPVSEAIKARRRAFLDAASGWLDTAIYDYAMLGTGHVVEGPAIVEAPTTTVSIPRGTIAEMDRLGNLIIRFQG
jgi:N-methylhydantoinase A